MNDVKNNIDQNTENNDRLAPKFGRFSIWAFSIGTSIGWGSLVVTCNTYLAQAGILGTVLGLVIGMIVILVITRNLRYMICKNQDAGGIYTFARNTLGCDYGFLAAWFLLLTYMSILWANITSVPLFMRYFFGDIFRFGFHYTIFGYEVYFGEALVSIIAICLIGFLCITGKKSINVIMITFAVAFVAGFTFCTVFSLLKHGGTSFGFDPLLLPDSSAVSQIAKIAVISPWAFIGFENVTHFSEEFGFKAKKIRSVLIVSVVLTTAVYLLVTLLSVTAYPEEYGSWFEYIADMGNLTGLKGIPAFYAINRYLGSAGVVILMIALLGAIVTSLIGNTMALSRLLYAAGRHRDAPAWLKKRNRQGNPHHAVFAVVAISVLIPFIGRTAIGWIVDVTTLGATIIYGLASYAVFKDARKNTLKTEQITGIAGLVLMLSFALMILLPNLFSLGAMASESYILFDLWAVIGLIYFRVLVTKDKERKYGRSVLVWVILLMFVLFASLMWVTRATQNVTADTMQNISEHYGDAIKEDDPYLKEQAKKMDNAHAMFTIASFAVFTVFAGIIFSNYSIMKKREEEHENKLRLAESRAATDQLTGIKNRHAYAFKEKELDERIAEGSIERFAILVADINNLKVINDNRGHNIGDECICQSCRLICKTFKHSPVYRIGGDEFAVVLEGEDYDNREQLLEDLRRKSVEAEHITGSTIAAGMSEYAKGDDASVLDVFTRADGIMYKNKEEMKKGAAH